MTECGRKTRDEADAHMLSSCVGDMGDSEVSHVKREGYVTISAIPHRQVAFDMAYDCCGSAVEKQSGKPMARTGIELKDMKTMLSAIDRSNVASINE